MSDETRIIKESGLFSGLTQSVRVTFDEGILALDLMSIKIFVSEIGTLRYLTKYVF